MPKTPTRRPTWPLWLMAVLALLLVLYAIVGFLVLPWWLEQRLPEQAERHLGWQTDTADIGANPFAFSVTLTDFNALNGAGDPVATIQKLHLDLSFFKLFLGEITIDELIVQQPYLRLRVDEDGSLNVIEDWRSNSPLAQPPETTGDTAEAGGGDGGPDFPLIIESARVERGTLLLQDHSTDTERNFNISPLNFELSGVAIAPEPGEAGHYQLTATLGEDERLAWEGEIVAVPFRSSGQIELRDIQAESLWHIVGRYAPYDWRQGQITLTTNYRIDTRGELQWALSNGDLALRDSRLFLTGPADEPALRVNRLNAEGVSYTWPQSRLEVGNIEVDDWTLEVSRNQAGQFDWVAALEEDDPDQGEDGEADAGEGGDFTWTVQHLGASQGRVIWRDASLDNPAVLSLQEIEAELNGLTGDPDQPVSVSLQLTDGQGGRGRLNGDFTVEPFTLEAALQLSDIALPQFQPYIGEYLQLDLRSGNADFDGSISLDDQQPELTGSLDGNLAITEVTSQLQEVDAPLLSWQSLRLEPLQVNLKPLAVDVRTVNFQGPELTYLRLPDSQNSFALLMAETEGSDADEEAEGDAQEADEPGPAVRIQQLNLEDGAVTIEDRAIEGGFEVRIHQIGGNVIGISNRKPQRGEITLQGKVAEQGSLRVSGEIGAIGVEDTTELELLADNVDLEQLTPYFVRYLGYTVDEGVLALAMDYTLRGDQLEGSNEVVLQNFSLGEKVESEAAIDAPVRAGIALLRGPGGTIEIDLPIEGNLSDPQFNFSDLMLTAFSNLVARAATAPFSVIASLANIAGFTGEDLSQVGFIPGTAELAPTKPDKLQALVDALKDRPGIMLRYRGATAPEWDRPALVLAEDNFTLPAAGLESQINALETRLAGSRGQAALNQLEQQHGGTAEERGTSREWAQALLEALAGDREPESGELRELAERRAQALRDALLERGIGSEQLSAADTRNDAPFEQGRVMIPLDVESR